MIWVEEEKWVRGTWESVEGDIMDVGRRKMCRNGSEMNMGKGGGR